eukprot:6203714-Pyramimonas_sp.AAC.1
MASQPSNAQHPRHRLCVSQLRRPHSGRSPDASAARKRDSESMDESGLSSPSHMLQPRSGHSHERSNHQVAARWALTGPA